jgi:hypothetical protein
LGMPASIFLFFSDLVSKKMYTSIPVAMHNNIASRILKELRLVRIK